jgi:hypothetical protein
VREKEKNIFRFLLRGEKIFLLLQPCSEGTGNKNRKRIVRYPNPPAPKMFGDKFFEVM